jgi:hypothetical protein
VQINNYYKQLEVAAPDEITAEIATLRRGWKEIIFSKDLMISRKIDNIDRPAEVSHAASKVVDYI